MARFISLLVVLTMMGCVMAACLMKDLSGLTLDSRQQILAVNNRPGAFVQCRQAGDKLDCTPLVFEMARYERYDFEGVTWVNDSLFYAVIEKRNNQCLAGCELSQEVLPFRINEKGRVVEAQCGSLTIPLMRGDDPGCAFANCGLEGITYDSRRRLLYVAKEIHKPRLFAVQLTGELCPTGSFVEIAPPERMSSYNDLAYSRARDSLFVLSSEDRRLIEWRLGDHSIGLRSELIPELHRFLFAVPIVEGVAVDDAAGRVMLLAESGRFISVPLPPVQTANQP
jgi:uncharacterized protein YjiK